MKRRLFGLLTLLLMAVPFSVAVAGTRLLLVARDHEGNPLSDFRFAYQGIESEPTTSAGATELALPPEHQPGQPIRIDLLVPGSHQAEEWFLVNPQVNTPLNTAPPAEVLLMRRSAFRQIAAETRDALRPAATGSGELATEDRKRALVEMAERHSLAAEQLEAALRSFAETQDTGDKGIVAYLEGEFTYAEELLSKAAENKESDFVETMLFLGAAQYEQAKLRAAADTFQEVVVLRSEDPLLLSWLGWMHYHLAEWNEAESLLRRALEISEKSFGPDDQKVAIDLNNLAQVLQETNRLAEAESLLRRALAIFEKSAGGPDHPDVAMGLGNLASLLQATNRLAEAEPLKRRALAIDEKRFGPDHPKVAIRLNNLAHLLLTKKRLAEAEPLLRRALAIDEKAFGPTHAKVAVPLNNLAALLYTRGRLAEAEPLLRRGLVIAEEGLGPDHPNVADALNNLAVLLHDRNQLTEAESLLRRALAIDEESFGPDHPTVAIRLNNLALLLQDMNRLAEAEPLMRRGLATLVASEIVTGHEHPHLRAAVVNYRQLLRKMGKTRREIKATLRTLRATE